MSAECCDKHKRILLPFQNFTANIHTLTTLGLKNQAKSPETASKQGRKKSNKYGKRRRSSSKNQMLDQPLVIVVLGGLQIEF